MFPFTEISMKIFFSLSQLHAGTNNDPRTSFILNIRNVLKILSSCFSKGYLDGEKEKNTARKWHPIQTDRWGSRDSCVYSARYRLARMDGLILTKNLNNVTIGAGILSYTIGEEAKVNKGPFNIARIENKLFTLLPK